MGVMSTHLGIGGDGVKARRDPEVSCCVVTGAGRRGCRHIARRCPAAVSSIGSRIRIANTMALHAGCVAGVRAPGA